MQLPLDVTDLSVVNNSAVYALVRNHPNGSLEIYERRNNSFSEINIDRI